MDVNSLWMAGFYPSEVPNRPTDTSSPARSRTRNGNLWSIKDRRFPSTLDVVEHPKCKALGLGPSFSVLTKLTTNGLIDADGTLKLRSQGSTLFSRRSCRRLKR